MIRDYSKYELSEQQKVVLYVIGYSCLFSVAYIFYHSLILASLLGILVKLSTPYVERYMAEKRRNKLNLQFKDLLYSLSASVAAGRQMAEAICDAERSMSMLYDSDELIMIELKHMKLNIVENKESDRILLQDFARRSCCEDINNFVQVYITCRDLGGDLAKIIEHATNVITDKMTIEREIRVITNQKKMEGRLISLMPFVMLLAMNFLSYSYVEPLYTTIAGRIIMTAALVTIGAGIYLMEKLSSVEV